MPEASQTRATVSFGPFEVDFRSAELRKHGTRIRLQEQPFLILKALLERPGELVTREELQQKIWPADTFVDFDHGLYSAMTRLREALNDSAERPRYIETLARKGYRFIGQLERTEAATSSTETTTAPLEVTASNRNNRTPIVIAMVSLVSIAALLALASFRAPSYTIMVLPFDVPSGNAVYVPVSQGVPRHIVSTLSGLELRGLSVKSLEVLSAMQSTPRNAIGTARDFGADAVLTGRLVREPTGHLLYVELLRVSDGAQIWGKEYAETDLGDLLQVQEDIATEVAQHLPSRYQKDAAEKLPRRYTRNQEAQALYERTTVLFYQATPDSLRKVIAYSRRAIELDPNYVLPYGQIASAYTLLGVIGSLPPAEAHTQAMEWSQKALRIDSSNMASRIALFGDQWSYAWDWQGIESAGMFHPFYTRALEVEGKFSELLPKLKAEAEGNPTDPVAQFFYGRALYYSRQYDAAIDQLSKALELAPNAVWAHMVLGYACVQKRRWREAEREFRAALPYSEDWALSALGYVAGASGNRPQARKIAAELEKRKSHEYLSPIFLAHVYIGLGDRERAIEMMTRACKERTPLFTDLKIDAIYDPMRTDKRFRELLRCANLAD